MDAEPWKQTIKSSDWHFNEYTKTHNISYNYENEAFEKKFPDSFTLFNKIFHISPSQMAGCSPNNKNQFPLASQLNLT